MKRQTCSFTRISLAARVTNEEVLRRVGRSRELMRTVRERQMRFIEHVMRENDLERTVTTGRVEGRRALSRQRMKYMGTTDEIYWTRHERK